MISVRSVRISHNFYQLKVNKYSYVSLGMSAVCVYGRISQILNANPRTN